MNLHPRPIVIVGMQRSGTSALAGALVRLGLFLGRDEWLYQADANNRQGYYEHRKATVLNLRCLETFQMHPTSFGEMPLNWRANPLAESLRGELREFIRGEFSKKGLWGVKQPVTSLVLPLYNDVFDQMNLSPHYVLCVRNPLEAMESEANLDFGDSYRVMPSLGKRAIGSWLRYTLGAFAGAAGHKLTVVPYESLLSDPERILRTIVSRDSEWTTTSDMWTEAIESVRRDFRHNRTEIDRLSEFPSLVARTYRTALQFDDTDASKWAEVLSHHEEFRAWVAVMSESEHPSGKLGVAWLDGAKQRIAEIGYNPTGDWQTVRLRIDAPPKTQVSGLLYGWPARIWIRTAIWVGSGTRIPVSLRTGAGSRLSMSGGVYRLDAVYEPNQIVMTTPGALGPYELEFEFLLEAGMAISRSASAQLAEKLEQSTLEVEKLTAKQRPAK